MGKQYFVYIIKCADDSYYTGVTGNLEVRFAQHINGSIEGCYTNNRQPLELVFAEEFKEIEEAIAREKQIKGWSRKKKEALIAGDFDGLIKLSKSHPSTSSG